MEKRQEETGRERAWSSHSWITISGGCPVASERSQIPSEAARDLAWTGCYPTNVSVPPSAQPRSRTAARASADVAAGADRWDHRGISEVGFHACVGLGERRPAGWGSLTGGRRPPAGPRRQVGWPAGRTSHRTRHHPLRRSRVDRMIRTASSGRPTPGLFGFGQAVGIHLAPRVRRPARWRRSDQTDPRLRLGAGLPSSGGVGSPVSRLSG